MCKQSDGESKCRQRSVLYENKSQTYQEDKKTTVHIGETALSGYERLNRHLSDFRNRPAQSHMTVHAKEEHAELDPSEVKYKYKVVKKFSSAFNRQIKEAIKIRMLTKQGVNILTTKPKGHSEVYPTTFLEQ